MKRIINILAVAALVAVILVASISPVLARSRNFGHNLHNNPSCEATVNAQNEHGAHHIVDPITDPPVLPGCWVVLPS